MLVTDTYENPFLGLFSLQEAENSIGSVNGGMDMKFLDDCVKL